MSSKRKTPFKAKHCNDFAFKVVQRDPISSVVSVTFNRGHNTGDWIIESNSMKFEIKPTIVDVVIGDFIWHLESDMEDDNGSEIVTKSNTLKLFAKAADATLDASYKVAIKNVIGYRLSVAHTSVGLSFWQIARVINQHKTISKNPILVDISDYNV
ncbi:hypothetical protein AXG93_2584s1230 [Marchantia polymorpha subsp. ruderalis]|uniref:Uncharacterized protein n=1 Tax=Marchantia polymorpha subsp. ruderalis TaxID=1480154 RepID=A0A176VGJ9_MARPO|nr:hypothetical protein AXG93_2584s1230 [Marchantia polymorpha subsp. ruderalis]